MHQLIWSISFNIQDRLAITLNVHISYIIYSVSSYPNRFFSHFVPGISFQHQLMGSPFNSYGGISRRRLHLRLPGSPSNLHLGQDPPPWTHLRNLLENKIPETTTLYGIIVGIRIVQLVSSEGIQLNISVRYIGSYYPLWNQPIPPWEKECHLQKCLLEGICLFPGG